MIVGALKATDATDIESGKALKNAIAFLKIYYQKVNRTDGAKEYPMVPASASASAIAATAPLAATPAVGPAKKFFRNRFYSQ